MVIFGEVKNFPGVITIVVDTPDLTTKLCLLDVHTGFFTQAISL